MQIKTKKVSVISWSLVLLWTLIFAWCELVLPQPPEPDLLRSGTNWTLELVIKHISLCRQGVAFDILDNNQSRDATGVVVAWNTTKVNDDTLTVEQKPETQSIETFLAQVSKNAPKWCTYTTTTRDGTDNYKITELTPSGTCLQNKSDVWITVYIHNTNTPTKVVKVEEINKVEGPRCDMNKSKLRYESIQFL